DEKDLAVLEPHVLEEIAELGPELAPFALDRRRTRGQRRRLLLPVRMVEAPALVGQRLGPLGDRLSVRRPREHAGEARDQTCLLDRLGAWRIALGSPQERDPFEERVLALEEQLHELDAAVALVPEDGAEVRGPAVQRRRLDPSPPLERRDAVRVPRRVSR